MSDPSVPDHPYSVRELLHYFGRCPACGHFAEAFEINRVSVDGNRTLEFLETCGLPCGWVGRRPDPAPLPRRDR